MVIVTHPVPVLVITQQLVLRSKIVMELKLVTKPVVQLDGAHYHNYKVAGSSHIAI